jgi:hypothetical protein
VSNAVPDGKLSRVATPERRHGPGKTTERDDKRTTELTHAHSNKPCLCIERTRPGSQAAHGVLVGSKNRWRLETDDAAVTDMGRRAAQVARYGAKNRRSLAVFWRWGGAAIGRVGVRADSGLFTSMLAGIRSARAAARGNQARSTSRRPPCYVNSGKSPAPSSHVRLSQRREVGDVSGGERRVNGRATTS